MIEFPRGKTELSKDDNIIEGICFNDGEGCQIGENGCTALIAYDEAGLYAPIPYIAVVYGDVVRMRIPAWMVSVIYADIN